MMFYSINKYIFLTITCASVFSAGAMDDCHVSSNSTPQLSPEKEPSRKRLRVDQTQSEPADSVKAVFKDPYLFGTVFEYLQGSDRSNFARVSKDFKQAAYLNHNQKEEFVAYLLAHRISPIRDVLKIAQGNKTVMLYNIECNTEKLVKLFHYPDSLLDEFVVDLSEKESGLSKETWLKQPLITLPEIARQFSSQERETLKRVNHRQLDYTDEITEDKIIKQVAKLVEQHPGELISLSFRGTNGNAQITASLINKLAQFPIVAVSFNNLPFPQGLDSLTLFKQLRRLTLQSCNLFGNTELSAEFFKGLPLLTFLEVTACGLTSLSPAIESLRHLRILNLNNNAITSLPVELHNLKKIKQLRLWQGTPLPAETIKCLPPLDGISALELPEMGIASNPIAESSDTQYLEHLTLLQTIEPLIRHPEKFRNLRRLELFITYPKFQLPACIAASLPCLVELSGNIPDDAIISYDALLLIAGALAYCSLFTQEDDIFEIRRIANLWQLIRSNSDIIKTDNIDLGKFDILMNQTITNSDLRHLITLDQTVVGFERLLRYNLGKHKQRLGLKESAAIVNELKQRNPKFATAITLIANEVCRDIPVVTDDIDNTSNGSQALNLPPFQGLLTVARAANAIMNTIKQGHAVTKEQLFNCSTQLCPCTRTRECTDYCKQRLIELFFHHAIECNDYSNTVFMFKHQEDIEYEEGTKREVGITCKVDINCVFQPDNDTALHIAIRNRESTEDEMLKQKIDLIIYFLMMNGADLHKKNSANQTPLELIAPGSSLNQFINYYSWRKK